LRVVGRLIVGCSHAGIELTVRGRGRTHTLRAVAPDLAKLIDTWRRLRKLFAEGNQKAPAEVWVLEVLRLTPEACRTGWAALAVQILEGCGVTPVARETYYTIPADRFWWCDLLLEDVRNAAGFIVDDLMVLS
jgi:hypothetical protein